MQRGPSLAGNKQTSNAMKVDSPITEPHFQCKWRSLLIGNGEHSITQTRIIGLNFLFKTYTDQLKATSFEWIEGANYHMELSPK